MGFIKDDMVFEPYEFGGFQCKMEVPSGVISVRYKGHGLFTDEEHPYEVYYPDEDAPTGYQTVDDIWKYITRSYLLKEFEKIGM